MSDFVETRDDPSVFIPTESIEEMEFRHEKETKELEERVKSMLKGLKKNAKAAAEAQAIQLGFDLKAKQRAEIDELEEYIGQLHNIFRKYPDFICFFLTPHTETHGAIVKTSALQEDLIVESAASVAVDRVQTKKEKAQRKKVID